MTRPFSHLILLAALLSASVLTAAAQQFDKYFEPATLRLDYIFAGDSRQQHIALDELKRIERWDGRRQRLAEVPVEGNGQVVVRAHGSQEVIYRQSFSTLFQEWLQQEEATRVTRSFENVFLVPMPKDTVDITVTLFNNRREAVATLTHTVAPTDILIRRVGDRPQPYTTLQAAAQPERAIHVAFVAEGFTREEMPHFIEKAREATDAIFAHEPFRSLRDRFTVTAVECASEESGTSIPRKGIWKRTALSSHFDTFYSDRYLTTLQLKALHDCLAGTPYEHIIVLVNTPEYGGGGILNSYNLSMTDHRMFRPVVVHEFGHSFAGLADEYAYESEPIPMYPADVEPWEPNITTLVDFESKWADLLAKRTPIPTADEKKNEQKIGAFEGAGYSLKGVYRPCHDCRMRTNENPEFCPVCQRAIRRLVEFYTGPTEQ